LDERSLINVNILGRKKELHGYQPAKATGASREHTKPAATTGRHFTAGIDWNWKPRSQRRAKTGDTCRTIHSAASFEQLGSH